MKASGNIHSVGLVGYGSMGSAMANAMARSEAFGQSFSLRVYAKNKQTSHDTAAGVQFSESLREIVLSCGIIIVAVRPEQVEEVVRQAMDLLHDHQRSSRPILVSVAAGVPLARLEEMVGKTCSVMRVMPNTLVEIGKGLFGLCAGPEVTSEENGRVTALFSGLGSVVELDERLMNAFTALAGCGPGFLFHILDALCEAGVSVGLTRQASQTIAIALMEGCGSLAAATGRHPVVLREQGTSPAGMTIAGLNHLDRTGARGIFIDAVRAALEQGERMNQEVSAQK